MKKPSRPGNPAAPGTVDWRLWPLVAEQRPAFMQALRLSLFIGVLMLAPSWYMFEVYGRVLSSRSHSTLAWLVVAVIGIYVLLELLELARARVLNRAAAAIDAKLTPRVFDVCFTAKLHKLPGGSTQGLADRKTIIDFISSPAVTGVMDLPGALLCLGLLFAMNFWVGVAATCGALLQAAIGLYQERRTARPLAEATMAQFEAQQRMLGTLANAKVVESMGMENALYSRWMQNQRRYLTRQAEASDVSGTASAATRLLQTMQGSALLGLACWVGLGGNLAGGMSMVIVASILGGRALAPAAQVVGQWRQFVNVRSAWRRLDALLAQVDVPEPGMPLPAPRGVLTVEGIMATAPGGRVPVLKNVSLAVKPGELMVVIGPSAAGKSTLARVLMGVWPAQAGNVRLDGADVAAWHKAQLGPHVGYVPQGVELFDGTIAENIARFGPVSMPAVRAAADEVGITALIEALPEGFDSAIGEDGAVLSGGQRQRIALARAIYGNPRLLVLDEPNASLDEAGDRDLLAMLQRLKARGTTIVAITHRGSLVGAADLLAVLVDGAIVATGPRDQVLAAMQKNRPPPGTPAAAGARSGTTAPTSIRPGMVTGKLA